MTLYGAVRWTFEHKEADLEVNFSGSQILWFQDSYTLKIGDLKQLLIILVTTINI